MEIVGQQWSWTFNYGIGEKGDCEVTPNSTEFPYSSYVHDSGTGSQIPQLYLPVDVTTRFNLHSPDVIHDFGIPGFLMKMDVVPGRVNHYSITPTRTGDFRGKCYELCGVYHSRMLFDVHVVTHGGVRGAPPAAARTTGADVRPAAARRRICQHPDRARVR